MVSATSVSMPRWAPTSSTDEATQSIRLTLPPSAFIETRSACGFVSTHRSHAGAPRRLRQLRPVRRSWSADESNVGAIVEAGTFGSARRLDELGLGQRAESRSSFVRLDSTWTLDLPERRETLRVGDSISTTGAWGQAARFGGVHFGTNFATQPTLVTTPLLSRTRRGDPAVHRRRVHERPARRAAERCARTVHDRPRARHQRRGSDASGRHRCARASAGDCRSLITTVRRCCARA